MAARFSNLATQFYRRSIVVAVFLPPLEIVRTIVALAGKSDKIKYTIRVRYKYMEWKVRGCMRTSLKGWKPSLSKPINRTKYTIRVVSQRGTASCPRSMELKILMVSRYGASIFFSIFTVRRQIAKTPYGAHGCHRITCQVCNKNSHEQRP